MNKFLFLIYLFITTTINSQTIFRGKIESANSEYLSGASVVVSNIKNKHIIAYDITNTKGYYNIKLQTKLDSLKIEVSFLGYSKQTKIVSNTTQKLNFTLLESSEELKEVFVKTEAIKQKGDTLSYRVSAFKNQKDRVIADVIRKMPGIDVLSDGKILYQGIPIQKYYIEGLDLLEGKYNLANNNLPASSVLKVQILENHQPIKLLDSIVFSEKTSLNIKLKNKITTTGTAKVGAGLSPLLWDVNFTPMLFSRNKQMISSYQTNNIGYDVTNETKYLTFEQLLDNLEGYNDKDWLRINELSPPSFSSKRWLNNNAHLVSSNYLFRIKKDVDFKIDLSYINDFQQQEGKNETIFLTPTESINIYEPTKNKLFFNTLKGKLIYNINSKKKYFKNTLSFNKNWNSNQSEMFGLSSNEQILATTDYSVSNKLKYTFPIKKKLVNFKSVFGYNKKPQDLSVSFSNSSVLNNNYDYDNFKQSIDYTNFYTNNHLGFTKKYNKFTVVTNFGFKTYNKSLKSNLDLFNTNNQINLPLAYNNNLVSNKYQLYNKLKFLFIFNNWKFTIKTPLSYLKFNIKDENLYNEQTISKFIVNPNLSISKQINTHWKILFNINKRNKFGDINQLHYGYILPNYNTVQRYNNPILESNTLTNRIYFSYKNPIKSLFYNFGYSFNSTNKNLITGIKIQNDGVATFGFLEKNNKRKSHSINLDFSKYFSSIKTTFSINSNYSKSIGKQLLNEKLIDTKTNNLLIKGALNSNIYNWLSINFKNEFSLTNNSNFSNINSEKYTLDLSFFPTKNQYISFDAEYYSTSTSNNHQNNYFLNLNYKYQLKKSKIDLEFNWNNILNTKHYINSYNNDYMQSITTYNLRPTQVLLSAKFSLESLF